MRYKEITRNYPYYCELYDGDDREYLVGVTAKFTQPSHKTDNAKVEDIKVFNIDSGAEITHTITSSEMAEIRQYIIDDHDPYHGLGDVYEI